MATCCKEGWEIEVFGLPCAQYNFNLLEGLISLDN